MKSFVLGALLVLACTGTLQATSAYPGFIQYRQPDGSRINLRMMGDEFLHWAETEDGFTLLSDNAGYMTLAIKDANGDLKPSKIRMLPGIENSPGFKKAKAQLAPHEAFSDSQIKESLERRATRSASLRSASALQGDKAIEKKAVVGDHKILVVLMQTSDVTFKHSSQEFDRLLNEVNYSEGGNAGSVHDFYYENSFGQLNLHCDVTPVYTAKNPMSYYGGNLTAGSDKHPSELAIEAITAASKDFNLADYDSDGDGYIDGVHIVFAGYGEESGGGDNCIWSHESTASPYFCYVGGKYMNKYSCSSELRGSSGDNLCYIGVFCHEIGHMLGTSDFYDTDYDNRGSCLGTGQWDLMASGNWNGNGAVPAHFNPYSKIYDFGWSDVQNGNVSEKKTLNAKTKGDFVRINTQTPGEYFLLEYRSQTGFDSALPGHGLMVYRASDNLSRIRFNTINAHHPQQFYPICANTTTFLPLSHFNAESYGAVNEPSAPFPGSLFKTELTDNSCPCMKDWEGNNTSYPITDIAEGTDNVSFYIAAEKKLPFNLHLANANLNWLELEWDDDAEEVMLAYNTINIFGEPGDRYYSAGQSLEGGGQILYVGTAHSFTHQGLDRGKTYYYRLFTKSPSGRWDSDRSLAAKTFSSFVSFFPFYDDFSSDSYKDSWSQEYLSGSNDWTIKLPPGIYDNALVFSWSSGKGPQQTTRAVLPTFNFSGRKNAYLEFEYRHFISDMYVVYRSAPHEEWRVLKELAPTCSGILPYGKNSPDASHVVIPLPGLSSSYQIAFVAEHCPAKNLFTAEIGAIDNITIDDYDDGVAVITGDLLSVASTEAVIDMTTLLFSDNARVSSFGIEWYADYSYGDTKRVTATPGQSALLLSDLPQGKRIDYRAYAVMSDGQIIFGRRRNFNTNAFSFSKGNGTKESPFIISSANDMNCLSKMEHTDGMYFELGASFTMPIHKNGCDFNGHFNGNNHTLTIEDCCGSIFFTIGPSGIVENLNVCAESYKSKGDDGLLADGNTGLIRHCNVHISNLFLSFAREFGGIAGKNYGLIQDCHSFIHLTCDNCHNGQAWVGGICQKNNGTIEGCSFDGRMSVNNNSYTGGIVSSNSGIVKNCINRGELNIETVNGESWFNLLGGIAGYLSDGGVITECVNEGTFDIEHQNNIESQVGGIVGSAGGNKDGSYVSYCINRGRINVLQNTGKFYCGGIVGDSYMGDISNCASCGDIYQLQTPSSTVQAVVGRHRGDNTYDCYYSCSLSDGKASKVSGWGNAIAAINESAGYDCMSLSDSKPIMSWEKEQDGLRFMAYDILDFSSTSIQGLFTLSSKAKEMGLMFKKEDADTWTKSVEAFTTSAHLFEIQGLQPTTWYLVKAYAVGQDGSVLYSDTKRIMTDMPYAGTQEDPYLIGSAADLKFLSIITHQGKSLNGCLVKMTQNIDLHADQGEIWTDVIGIFNGEFDGCGHYIHNAKFEFRGLCYGLGLFTNGNGYIHDLFFHNVDIDCVIDDYPFMVGSIVGECDRIERCGFVGNFNITYNGITFGSQGVVGGLAGKVYTEARDCYAFLSISTNLTQNLGAIIGIGNVYSSYSAILSTQYVRSKIIGTAGYSTSGCTNCYYYKPMLVEKYDRKDIEMPLSQMKDGTLLSQLTAGVWTANTDDQRFDYGFPILASQGPFPEPCYGDANVDGLVTVSDFTAVANHLLELPNGRFSETAADVNQDMSIDAADLSGIVNMVLYGFISGSSGHSHSEISPDADLQMTIPDFRVNAGGTARIPVYVQNVGIGFSAYQIDLRLPLGMRLTEAVLSDDRTDVRATDFFSWKELGPGYYRILCASTSGRKFKGNSGIVAELSIEADESMAVGDGDLSVSGVKFAENAQGYRVPDFNVGFTVSAPTGMTRPKEAAQNSSKEAYNLSGQRVRDGYRGIIILNRTKILQK